MSSLKDGLLKITQGVKPLSSFESNILLVLGLIRGAESEVKFGHSANSTNVNTDIWARGDVQPVYIFPNVAGEVVEILSTEIADTQQIIVFGLDELGLPKIITVTLAGTTPVELPGLWTAVNRCRNDSASNFTGVVNIQGNGSTSTNIFATALAVDQVTTQAIYTVASNKVAIICGYLATINKTGGTTVNTVFTLSTARPNKVFTTNTVFGLQREGSSNANSELCIPELVGPGTKIKVKGLASFDGTDLSANLSIMLIDKDLVPDETLVSLL